MDWLQIGGPSILALIFSWVLSHYWLGEKKHSLACVCSLSPFWASTLRGRGMVIVPSIAPRRAIHPVRAQRAIAVEGVFRDAGFHGSERHPLASRPTVS